MASERNCKHPFGAISERVQTTTGKDGFAWKSIVPNSTHCALCGKSFTARGLQRMLKRRMLTETGAKGAE